MHKIKLFIFDMDGLLIETGRLAYRAYLKSAEKYDYEITHNVYYYLTGQKEDAIRLGMEELYGADVPYNEWRDAMNQFKNEIYAEEKRVYKKNGAVEILEFAKENQLVIALASSNHQEKIAEFLKVEGLTDYFDVIISGDEVSSGKPNPEIFLAACEKTDISPENALVFEDSAAGIEAAKRAGILSILVEDNITDLPTRKGHYPLLKDLSFVREKPAPADFQFFDLHHAKNFLAKKELYL
ncbi:beta-phosphoglucomutase [Enterococcus sp. PF1-24]|uniref:HAD family hydrolase n=1 Tax=unclassified Enterococcus TaxID=2608891 RepID=UPI0024766988|nr:MULTISPECIES: HAD family phosphatase [unclassified Enterococcus]MDH6364932.1 beta-phosphoglucomutase [Enterococcus sp. PFB1-1]MDH6402033.1 beta-phosphoglucomutase [Enterococcus sp. PF1-24]